MKSMMIFIIMITVLVIFHILDKDKKIQRAFYEKANKIIEVIKE